MGIFFNRTPAVAKAARRAYQNGDSLYHVAMLYEAGDDPNEAINQVAREGWDLAFFHVVVEGDKTIGVYLFRRREQAPQP